MYEMLIYDDSRTPATENLVSNFFTKTLPTLVKKLSDFFKSLSARFATLAGKAAMDKTDSDILVHRILTLVSRYMGTTINVYKKFRTIKSKEEADDLIKDLVENNEELENAVIAFVDKIAFTGEPLSRKIYQNASIALRSWDKWINLISDTLENSEYKDSALQRSVVKGFQLIRKIAVVLQTTSDKTSVDNAHNAAKARYGEDAVNRVKHSK